jgi:hypothetical protein
MVCSLASNQNQKQTCLGSPGHPYGKPVTWRAENSPLVDMDDTDLRSCLGHHSPTLCMSMKLQADPTPVRKLFAATDTCPAQYPYLVKELPVRPGVDQSWTPHDERVALVARTS